MGCIFCLLLASLFIFTEMSNIIVSLILLLHHASELNHIHVCFQQESGFTSHLFAKQQAILHGERKGANHGRKNIITYFREWWTKSKIITLQQSHL